MWKEKRFTSCDQPSHTCSLNSEQAFTHDLLSYSALLCMTASLNQQHMSWEMSVSPFFTCSCSWLGVGSSLSFDTAAALCSTWLWGASVSRPRACPWELVRIKLLLPRLPRGGVRSWKVEGRSWISCWRWVWWCCCSGRSVGTCQLCCCRTVGNVSGAGSYQHVKLEFQWTWMRIWPCTKKIYGQISFGLGSVFYLTKNRHVNKASNRSTLTFLQVGARITPQCSFIQYVCTLLDLDPLTLSHLPLHWPLLGSRSQGCRAHHTGATAVVLGHTCPSGAVRGLGCSLGLSEGCSSC